MHTKHLINGPLADLCLFSYQMSEDDSFEMMKYILFHRELRKQYKPDMDALQV